MGLELIKKELNSFKGTNLGIVTDDGLYEMTESSQVIYKEDVVILADMVILDEWDDVIDRRAFKIKGKDIVEVEVLEIFEDVEIHIDLVDGNRMIILGI